jgi:multimeric flavodoxin WrbA
MERIGGSTMAKGGNVIAVYGSPRRNGNSAALAKKAIEAVRAAGGNVEEFYLHGMEIKPCRACDSCRSGRSRYCVIDDDMQALYPKIETCSAILLATPVYWFSVTAQLKLFMDRWYGLNSEKTKALAGKKVGIILTYGDTDPYSSGGINAIRTLEDAFKYVKSKVVGIVYGSANDIGDAEKDAGLVARAARLGKLLL